MNLNEKSNLYFIYRWWPGEDAMLDIRSTENGARDFIGSVNHWGCGPETKIGLCVISGEEILRRSVHIDRNLIKQPIFDIQPLLKNGRPHYVELDAAEI